MCNIELSILSAMPTTAYSLPCEGGIPSKRPKLKHAKLFLASIGNLGTVEGRIPSLKKCFSFTFDKGVVKQS